MPSIAQPSIQSLLIKMQVNGQVLSTGTAFVASSPKGPHLVTNRHNVTGRHAETNAPLSDTGGLPNELVVLHNRHGIIGEWVSRVENLYSSTGVARWIEHPILGEKADFVALPLSTLQDVALYPYDMANTGPDLALGPADTVSVIGFPFGMTAGGAFGVWATGFLASEPAIDFNGLPIQLIDCRSRQGQSGSPVLSYRSGGAVALSNGSTAIFTGPVFKFVGIYSGRINPDSDLGFVWKASAINELLQAL